MPDSKTPNSKTRRIFLALWPNNTIRDQIEQQLSPLFKKPGPRRVPRRNWHITLAFLGNVSQQAYDCVIQQAEQVQGNAFELQLSALGYWSRSRVVWLGADSVPAALSSLVSNLNQHLVLCGYQPDHPEFVPHMTVLRKASRAPATKQITPITWKVDGFVLVESVTSQRGSEYSIVKQWSLQDH